MQFNPQVRAWRESAGRGPRLFLAVRFPAQQHITDAQARMPFGEAEQRAASPYLQVVRVRAEGQDRQRHRIRHFKPKCDHAGTTEGADRLATSTFAAPARSGSQTIQGQSPWWYISSSRARSFTVSAGDQYPLYG